MRGANAVKDAVSTGQIFLQSELNKADTILHMPLEGHTWFRDIPLTNGGGWVTSETSEFVSVGDSNVDGAGAGANDIGVVNYTRSQDVYPAFPWQRSIRIPLIESLMLAQANKSPNDILNDSVRVVWNKTLDQRVYQGKFGKPGLVNQTVRDRAGRGKRRHLRNPAGWRGPRPPTIFSTTSKTRRSSLGRPSDMPSMRSRTGSWFPALPIRISCSP